MITPLGLSLMSANKSFADGMQFAWDATSLKLWQTCPRKYYYEMIEGWKPRHASDHLRFGAVYATALEHYHKHLTNGADKADALINIILEALISTWDYTYEEVIDGEGILDTPEGPIDVVEFNGKPHRVVGGKPWQSFHSAKTRANVIRTIIWYIDHFAEDATKVVKLSDGRAAVEYSFTLPVDNGWFFTGHIDRLVDYAGDVYVMDQKTTGGTVGPYWFKQFNPDTQMSMYTFAGQMIYGAAIKGVMIDAAQIAVGFSRFERGFTFRTQAQLDEWYSNTMFHIETARHHTKEQHFPMNESACGNYGGCPYLDICARQPAMRENFLAGDFERRPAWDPLTRR